MSFLLIYAFSSSSASSENIYLPSLSQQLEKGLNERNFLSLKNLFSKKSFTKFKKEYDEFTKNYNETEWIIKPKINNNNKQYLDIKMNSRRQIGGQKYNLNSSQTIELKTNNNKILDYKTVNEESILKSYKNNLKIKVDSPERVMTGERYHFDLIIEKPIDNSFITGGMIALEDINSNKQFSIPFGMKPKGSGGLFKSITAPLKPGSQIISAIIAHEKGILTITKKLEVD